MIPESDLHTPKEPNKRLVLTHCQVQEGKGPYRVVFDCSFSQEESTEVDSSERASKHKRQLIDIA